MKILVTYQIPRESLEELEEEHEIFYPTKLKMETEEILEIIAEYDALISVFGHKVDDEVIKKGVNLKIISNYGGGVDNINLKLATEHRIIVTNTPDSVTAATAEMAMGMLLSLCRRIAECDRKLRCNNIKWGVMENLGTTLQGKTLGIIGMGKIGKAFARLAIAFGMKIIYNNRNKISLLKEIELNAKWTEKNELLKTADVISLNTPLTAETRYLIDFQEFELMKPTAMLINTARGAVVNETALINALANKKIAGAALDVFENEPFIAKELLEFDNIVLTPHTGTGTHETRMEIGIAAAKNLLDFFAGIQPQYIVNKDFK